MNKATITDLDVIRNIFAPYHKTYFPHIRTDYLAREIAAGNVILKDDVVIIYKVYKRTQQIGSCQAQKGDVILKQIVAKQQGHNAFEVAKTFLDQMNTNVWLTVREENHRARAFYKKLDFQEVGSVNWSSGKISGIVYLWKKL